MGFSRNACRRHAVVHACKALGDTAPFIWVVFPIVLAMANAPSVGRMGRILHAQTLNVRGWQIRVCLRIGHDRGDDHDRDFTPRPYRTCSWRCCPLRAAQYISSKTRQLRGLCSPTLLPKAIRKRRIVQRLLYRFRCASRAWPATSDCYSSEDNILTDAAAYPLGMGLAAILCFVIASIARVGKRTEAAYKLLPYFMVAAIVAIAFFLSNHVEFDTIAFTLAVILAGIFELFVISYFGTMSSKGHIAPVAAFCASSAIVRLGFSIGEVWAVLYEDIQGIWGYIR